MPGDELALRSIIHHIVNRAHVEPFVDEDGRRWCYLTAMVDPKTIAVLELFDADDDADREQACEDEGGPDADREPDNDSEINTAPETWGGQAIIGASGRLRYA